MGKRCLATDHETKGRDTSIAPTTKHNMISLFALLLAVGCALARNPVVISPRNATLNAGDTIIIEWGKANTGFVNIDLVGLVLGQQPLLIAHGVPATQQSYSWKVPEVLRTAVGYQVRVWGTSPPAPGETEGISELFTVFNNIPKAINAFKVLSPSKEQPCIAGKKCMISWDFPQDGKEPAFVHINLFQAGNQNPLVHIGDAAAADKSFVWEVPANAAYMEKKGLYVSVSGAGTPVNGPAFSNEMGANSYSWEFGNAAPVAGAFGQAGVQEAGDNNQFKAQEVEDVETQTITVTTGTTTIKTTVTESNAAAGMASSSSFSQAFWFLVVPLLVLLF